MLRCIECDTESESGYGWRAEIVDDPDGVEPAEVALYCPVCAEREFGPLLPPEQRRGAY